MFRFNLRNGLGEKRRWPQAEIALLFKELRRAKMFLERVYVCAGEPIRFPSPLLICNARLVPDSN